MSIVQEWLGSVGDRLSGMNLLGMILCLLGAILVFGGDALARAVRREENEQNGKTKMIFWLIGLAMVLAGAVVAYTL